MVYLINENSDCDCWRLSVAVNWISPLASMFLPAMTVLIGKSLMKLILTVVLVKLIATCWICCRVLIRILNVNWDLTMIITLSMIVMGAGRQMFLRHFLLNDGVTVRHFGLSQQNVGFDDHFSDDRGVDVRDVFRVEPEHRRTQGWRNPARPI